jgi:hypothetical protein
MKTTKAEYLEREWFLMRIQQGWEPLDRDGQPVDMAEAEEGHRRELAAAWHSLSDSDRAELDARPPAPGRPRFVSAGVVLRPTQGFMDLVSGAADDAVEGKP